MIYSWRGLRDGSQWGLFRYYRGSDGICLCKVDRKSPWLETIHYLDNGPGIKFMIIWAARKEYLHTYLDP